MLRPLKRYLRRRRKLAHTVTGEDLINSVTQETTIEEFELLFVRLSNHISWFKAEQNLTDQQLESILSSVLKAVHLRIDSLPDPTPVKVRLNTAFANARKFSGPSTIH